MGGTKKNNKKDPGTISKKDSRLFRQSVGEIDKVDINQADISKTKPKPVPEKLLGNSEPIFDQFVDNTLDIDDVEMGEELSFFRPGVQKQTLRKLRRGQIAIERELDLHGLTVDQALPVLSSFLNNVSQSDQRCVRIIHGKGRGSKNKLPILKNKLNQWLQQHDKVLAFCSARPNDGGTGAVYVLLKKLE